MGNKFTFDEQVEDLVKRMAGTYQFEQVDKFFR